jgi:hypothetical protein
LKDCGCPPTLFLSRTGSDKFIEFSGIGIFYLSISSLLVFILGKLLDIDKMVSLVDLLLFF